MFVRLGDASIIWMAGYLLIINFIYCFADKGCPCGSYQSEQSCYYVTQKLVPREEATLYCEALGYHLVTIGSAKENMVIKWIISEVVNEREYAIIHYLLIYDKHLKMHYIRVHTSGSNIVCVNYTKFIGVIIDNKMKHKPCHL